MARFLTTLAMLCLALTPAVSRAAAPIAVVAAENFYGDIAKQVGGDAVSVTSILTNPDQDPHLFEVSPSVARAVAAARIVISNGLDYDPWMDRMIATARVPGRHVITAAALVGRKPGDNPHVWYDPATMLALAQALSHAYAALDPGSTAAYAQRLARFEASMVPVQARIDSLRRKLEGQPVTATEPMFGYMFAVLGLHSRNQRFQLSVMNETEASASDIAAFEDDLRSHRVRLLVFNRQARDPAADRMKAIARAAGIPIVGASENEPAGVPYQTWILGELDAVGAALGGTSP